MDLAVTFTGADCSRKLSRNIAIDGLRGLLLVIIAINHLESPLLTPFTREPLGFVSAAEAFIFLSGLVAARVYSRYLYDSRELMGRVYKRVLTLYLYVLIGTLSITALLHLNLLSEIWYRDWGGYFLLENYLNYPWQSLLLSSVQLQQMGYLDILIAYMLPMLFLPWALMALKKGHGLWVILASFSFWLMAQFTTDQLLLPIYQMVEPGLKMEAGYLDIFAWQFLFYTGVCVGFYTSFKEDSWLDSLSLLKLALAASFVFFLAKHLDWSKYLSNELLLYHFNWQDLGLVRYFNTLILAFLAAWLVRRQFVVFCLKPLVFLGQHSLQVFTFHAVAIYFFLPWMMGLQETYYQWYWDLALVCCFIGCLFMPAWLHKKHRKIHRHRQENLKSHG